MEIAAKEKMGDRIKIVSKSKEAYHLMSDFKKFGESDGADELMDSIINLNKTMVKYIKVEKYAPHSHERLE